MKKIGKLLLFSAILVTVALYLYGFPQDRLGNGEPGTLKWRFATEGWVYSSPAMGSDGTIYVGSADHHLYALSPDGTEKWRFNTGSWIYSSSAIGNDGTIYIVSTGQRLYIVSGTGNGLANAPWPMFHHDLRHTGRAGEP